jgi:tRNA(Ile)-lysidine synthase
VLDGDDPPRSPDIAAAIGPVRAALRRSLGDPRHRRVLIACSGGADSMAALGLLTILRRSEQLELIVGHVDHGLRRESASEGELVAEVARALGHTCLRMRLQLDRGPGLPARAREARRAALESQRRESGAEVIVLAHTSTDQAETLLMHLVRGAGLEGLAAMQELDGPWLRPLLELGRAQTRALCGALDLPFVDDPTNADEEATRIWLREQVLPRMREDNPRLEQALLGLTREAADAERALLEWAAREIELRRGAEGWSLAGFDALPRAVRTRALRHACADRGVELGELRRAVIDQIDAAAVAVARASRAGPGTPSPAPRGWDLHPLRRVEIDKSGLRIDAVAPQAGDPHGRVEPLTPQRGRAILPRTSKS